MKRTFAREWRWWVACWPVAYILIVTTQYRDLTPEYRELLGINSVFDVMKDPDWIVGAIALAVPLYLVVGLVRITIWSFRFAKAPDSHVGAAKSSAAERA